MAIPAAGVTAATSSEKCWNYFVLKFLESDVFGEAGAGQVGAGQVGAGQVGAVQIGVGQISAGQVGAGQIGVAQVSAGQIGVAQVSAGQIGVAQVSVGQIGVAQVSAGQIGVGQISAGQVGVCQVGTGQVGAGQVGAGQVGAGQVGAGQVGAGQVGVGQAPPKIPFALGVLFEQFLSSHFRLVLVGNECEYRVPPSTAVVTGQNWSIDLLFLVKSGVLISAPTSAAWGMPTIKTATSVPAVRPAPASLTGVSGRGRMGVMGKDDQVVDLAEVRKRREGDDSPDSVTIVDRIGWGVDCVWGSGALPWITATLLAASVLFRWSWVSWAFLAFAVSALLEAARRIARAVDERPPWDWEGWGERDEDDDSYDDGA